MATERSFHVHYGLTDTAAHGNNRRPSRRDPEFKVDPAELAAWNAKNAAARAEYRTNPNQMIRSRLAR